MSTIRKTSIFCAVLLSAAFSVARAQAAMIFVSNEKDDTVTVVDSDSLKVVKTIPVGHRPRGIIITPDHKDIIVCLGDDAQLAVIDANTFKVTRLLDSGSDPELLNIDPEGRTLYIANEDDSLVTVMDFKTGEVTKEVPIGVEPEGMAVSPDGHIVVATSEFDEHGAFHRHDHLQGGGKYSRRIRARDMRNSRVTAPTSGSHPRLVERSRCSTPSPVRSCRRSISKSRGYARS